MSMIYLIENIEDKEGNRILRQKYKLDYLTDTEVEKIFIN